MALWRTLQRAAANFSSPFPASKARLKMREKEAANLLSGNGVTDERAAANFSSPDLRYLHRGTELTWLALSAATFGRFEPSRAELRVHRDCRTFAHALAECLTVLGNITDCGLVRQDVSRQVTDHV